MDDNQGYVDDLKHQYGKQQDLFSQAKLPLGTDWKRSENSSGHTINTV